MQLSWIPRLGQATIENDTIIKINTIIKIIKIKSWV